MKRICAIIIILFSYTFLFGQTKTHVKPFIIKGQFTDCPERQLAIIFSDHYGQPLTDTLHLDDKGNFYLRTFKVNGPQRVEIKGNKVGIRNIFAAPGYDLTLTGIGKDRQSMLESKKIAGAGSESNQYYCILDSIQSTRKDEKRWLDLNETDLLSYAKKAKNLKDSVALSVFKRPAKQDEYLPYFESMVGLDNQFYQLYMLVTHVYWNDYDYDKSVSFVKNNFDHKVLDALYKDQYLISKDYRVWLIANAWLDYVVHLDYKRDSTLQTERDYKLKKVAATYKGKVKEFSLYHLIKYDIELISSFEEINEYKQIFETCITEVRNKDYRTSLESEFTKKEELLLVQAGRTAPSFALESDQEISYSLEHFKNKVVYLDLWASWCIPCREEMPSFKLLHDKYKYDQRIVFISIAVRDEKDKWKRH